MLYTSPTQTSTTVTGRAFAYRCRGLNAVQRAFLAADLHLGNIVVEAPTIGQSAALARCTVPNVRAALRTDPDRRWTIEAGIAPLIPFDTKILEHAIRAVGVDRAFDVLCKQID